MKAVLLEKGEPANHKASLGRGGRDGMEESSSGPMKDVGVVEDGAQCSRGENVDLAEIDIAH